MPAAGRVVEVDADRLPIWVERFAERHGPVTMEPEAADLVIIAPDGARADIAIPHGPLPPSALVANPIEALADHVRAPRTVGILLVRRGGWAAGVIESGQLVAAEVGGGYVQGRTKAGGWSQQRYARRRGHQTEQVWQRAANGAVAVLVPRRAALEALVTGGDRPAVTAVLADRRLTSLGTLIEPRFLAVPDPSRAALADVVRRLRTVAVTLNDLA